MRHVMRFNSSNPGFLDACVAVKLVQWRERCFRLTRSQLYKSVDVGADWRFLFDSLNPFDCCKPGRCAVFVESRLKPVGFDGGDIPSIAGVERRSQLFLADWV